MDVQTSDKYSSDAPAHDRPRERLRKHGCVAASDVDLLAAVIGSGIRGSRGPVSANDLGHGLLGRHKSLRAIAALEVEDLMGVSGLGPAKSTAIVAAFEMGRRVAAESVEPQEPIRGPGDVFKRFAPFIRDLPREVFNVVLLNTAARVIRTFTASEGGLAASIVEPRIVFRRAILANAASIICLHNHPSGNPEPSKEDIQITSQLSEAGRVLGIPLQDHLIIAGDGFTSLAERGMV
jgi:DNA repair protein RadC